jgi:hypothetical protein
MATTSFDELLPNHLTPFIPVGFAALLFIEC